MPSITLSDANRNAFLSSQAYNPNYHSNAFSSAAHSHGFEYLESRDVGWSGLRADVYRDIGTGHITVSFAGTSNTPDFFQDFVNTLGEPGVQDAQAFSYVRNVISRYGGHVRGNAWSKLANRNEAKKDWARAKALYEEAGKAKEAGIVTGLLGG